MASLEYQNMASLEGLWHGLLELDDVRELVMQHIRLEEVKYSLESTKRLRANMDIERWLYEHAHARWDESKVRDRVFVRRRMASSMLTGLPDLG